jgi:diguanylate cyclase (GGDEF)-like protein/PAS domain S-box-containing protein
MRLAPFIRENIEPILEEWEEFARSIQPARHMDRTALRDHAKSMLLVIADDMDQPQSDLSQKEKSRGHQAPSKEKAAAEHGFDRQSSGFSITETISEFRALRASVSKLWKRQAESVTQDHVDDLIRFNEAIDEAVDTSIVIYAEVKERHTQFLDVILKNSPDAIYLLDADSRFLYANHAMENLYGLSKEQIIGEKARGSRSPLDAELQAQIGRAMNSGESYRGELSHIIGEGDQCFEYFFVPVLGDDNELEAGVGILHNITERKIAEDKIWHNANHDLLTGLPNRRLFFDRLEQDVEHSARTGLSLAVLYIDLNGFKEVNDQLGHQVGDQLLQQVADRLDTCIRKADTAARLGGDEFTVVLTDLRDIQNASAVAQNISEALDREFEIQGQSIRVSASIGITFYPKDASSPEELLKKADHAMYQAKNSQHHKICLFDAASPDFTSH